MLTTMHAQEGHLVKRLMLLGLVVLLMASPVVADGRRHREPPPGYPFDEMVEGEYHWTPDWRPRTFPPWPRRFVVDKAGRCEVRCERTDGWAYQCRSYRC